MFVVNDKSNDIDEIKAVSFSEAGLKERQNLQEWIAKNPMCLGEELLIIQKEFAGFDDTRERLDLLALDKTGNLVIIENKLDDSGKDVVWQALKYVSYCSSLKAQDIEQIFNAYLSSSNNDARAEEILTDFFEDENYEELLNVGYSQRMIFVAANYRKEVTSTVMWLLNNGINITCFKVTPHKFQEKIILDFNQIIPLKEAGEFMIKIASKQKEEVFNQKMRSSRDQAIIDFWKQFLQFSNEKTALTHNLSPAKYQWIPVSLGMGGVSLNLVVSGRYARSEVYINRGTQEENKKVFDTLLKHKNEIEAKFGDSFEWERMDNKVTSRIKYQKNEVSVYNEDDREEINLFLVNTMLKMHDVFKEYINGLDR